ncbi:MAG: hypothetical protein QOJ16_3202 [Acidobacteriota bacterium]|jgi:hypothetical protein|nr:hypothetical protein [Acidobacteriota bacterium]
MTRHPLLFAKPDSSGATHSPEIHLRAKVLSRPLLLALLALGLVLPPLPASAAVVPDPSPDLSHRFGVYAWGFDTSSYPAGAVSPDRLNWAADKVARTGSRTIRVYLGARDDYRVNPAGLPADDLYLARLVAGPGFPGAGAGTAYDRLFLDSRFDTYLLTVYSPGDDLGNWLDGFTAEEAALERTQIARLGDLLLDRYPVKTFILLNWEGDNALSGHLDDRQAWDGFASWTAARAAGVRDAQARHPGATERLFSGLEFNRLRRDGVWCGADESLDHRCVVDSVAPGADVDYYSYSAWETLSAKQRDPAVALKDELRADLGHALALVRKARPEVTPSRFLLGEAGFARTTPRYGECRAAADLRELADAVVGSAGEPAFGVSYVVVWQVLDNAPGEGGTPQSFGLYRSDGGPTVPGVTFRSLLAGTRRPLPAGCPRLADCPGNPDNSCGATDRTAPWRPPSYLLAGDLLSLAGEGFSASGNTVHIAQGKRRFTVQADGLPGWRESPERIDFRLPRNLPPGEILLWVTDARGLDSNGEILTVVPRPERWRPDPSN